MGAPDRRTGDLLAQIRAALEPFERYAAQLESPPNWIPLRQSEGEVANLRRQLEAACGALHAGKKGRRDGKCLIDNPHDRGSAEAVLWEGGWKLEHYDRALKGGVSGVAPLTGRRF